MPLALSLLKHYRVPSQIVQEYLRSTNLLTYGLYSKDLLDGIEVTELELQR